MIRRFLIPGLIPHVNEVFHEVHIAADHYIYVPCSLDEDIKVFSLAGQIVRRIDLSGTIIPIGVTLTENGAMYITGLQP